MAIKRQTILIIAFSSVAGMALLVRLGPALISPFIEGSRMVDNAKKELARLNKEVPQKRRELLTTYRELCGKTLAMDEHKAQANLQELLNELAKATQLGKLQFSNPYRGTVSDKKTKARRTVVRVTVIAECPLRNLVNFLDAFYRLPYLVNIIELHLAPPEGGAPPGSKIKVQALVETLVMQPIPKGIERDDKPITVASLDPNDRPEDSGRLTRRTRPEYDLVCTRDVFAIPAPPPPASKPAPVAAAPAPKNRFDKVPPKGPDQRAATMLVGVARYPWYDPDLGADVIYQEAITRNKGTEEKRVVRTGEPLDVGNLVFVDAEGAVVRTASRDMFFYPLGKAFTESTRLDPNSHPELYRAVQELEKQQ